MPLVGAVNERLKKMPLVRKDSTRGGAISRFCSDFHHTGGGKEVKDTHNPTKLIYFDTFASVGVLKNEIVIVVFEHLSNDVFGITQNTEVIGGQLIDSKSLGKECHSKNLLFFVGVLPLCVFIIA